MSDGVNARLGALERKADTTRTRPAQDETGGTVDGILEAIPDVGGAYNQAEIRAVIAAMTNNIAELQAQFDAQLERQD